MLTSFIARDYITIYKNIESLCCTSETSVMLCVNYISIKKKREEKKEKNKERKLSLRLHS